MVSILPLAFPEAENVSKHLNARSVAAPHKCLLTPITEPLKRKKSYDINTPLRNKLLCQLFRALR